MAKKKKIKVALVVGVGGQWSAQANSWRTIEQSMATCANLIDPGQVGDIYIVNVEIPMPTAKHVTGKAVPRKRKVKQ